MQKIKALFVVERSVQMVTRERNPEAEWVFNGDGVATIKYDGTPALIKDGILYKRWNRALQKKHVRAWKRSDKTELPPIEHFKEPPAGAIALENKPADVTLHFPYWVPVTAEDKFFNIAFEELTVKADGTYELVGPKIQGNMYELDSYQLWKHGTETIEINDYSFDGLRALFSNLNAEGIVWHRPNGDMIKLRRSHFNFDWKDDPRNDKTARDNFKP